MKTSKQLTAAIILTGFLAIPFVGQTEDKKDEKKTAKPKPYPLQVCAVSDEKLGDMGDPYVFAHEGREVKLCCKSCLKDFKKDPAKYVKKIDAAEKKPKKSS